MSFWLQPRVKISMLMQHPSAQRNLKRHSVFTYYVALVGVVNVTVSAEAVPSHISCDNEVVSVPDRGRIDTVTRSLIVKVGKWEQNNQTIINCIFIIYNANQMIWLLLLQAEGTEIVKAHNWLFCPKGEFVLGHYHDILHSSISICNCTQVSEIAFILNFNVFLKIAKNPTLIPGILLLHRPSSSIKVLLLFFCCCFFGRICKRQEILSSVDSRSSFHPRFSKFKPVKYKVLPLNSFVCCSIWFCSQEKQWLRK